MVICSKCGKECDAKIESRSANPIYRDSVAVSMCCGAEIIDAVTEEGYYLDEDGLQGCRHYGVETRGAWDNDLVNSITGISVAEEKLLSEGWVNIDVYNLPSGILEDGKEFMLYNALYSQWEETDEDVLDLLKQLRSKRILLKYREVG